MSHLMYLASDCPLEEIQNVHYRTKLLSANEAAAAGIRLPDWLDSIGSDKPDTILWQDKGPFEEWQREENGGDGFDDDYSILKLSDSVWEIKTEKKYQAEIAWGRYSKGRARNIIAYIQKHLEWAEELEIWSFGWGTAAGGQRFTRNGLHWTRWLRNGWKSWQLHRFLRIAEQSTG